MIREWFWRSFHPLWIFKIGYKNKNSFRTCGMDGKPLSNGFVALVVSPLYLEPHFCSTEKRIFRHGVVTTSCVTDITLLLIVPAHTTLWVNPEVFVVEKREINCTSHPCVPRASSSSPKKTMPFETHAARENERGGRQVLYKSFSPFGWIVDFNKNYVHGVRYHRSRIIKYSSRRR